MNNNQNVIFINCFYYGFYIKKEDLDKYNINQNNINENIKYQQSQKEYN